MLTFKSTSPTVRLLFYIVLAWSVLDYHDYDRYYSVLYSRHWCMMRSLTYHINSKDTPIHTCLNWGSLRASLWMSQQIGVWFTFLTFTWYTDHTHTYNIYWYSHISHITYKNIHEQTHFNSQPTWTFHPSILVQKPAAQELLNTRKAPGSLQEAGFGAGPKAADRPAEPARWVMDDSFQTVFNAWNLGAKNHVAQLGGWYIQRIHPQKWTWVWKIFFFSIG